MSCKRDGRCAVQGNPCHVWIDPVHSKQSREPPRGRQRHGTWSIRLEEIEASRAPVTQHKGLVLLSAGEILPYGNRPVAEEDAARDSSTFLEHSGNDRRRSGVNPGDVIHCVQYLIADN